MSGARGRQECAGLARGFSYPEPSLVQSRAEAPPWNPAKAERQELPLL